MLRTLRETPEGEAEGLHLKSCARMAGSERLYIIALIIMDKPGSQEDQRIGRAGRVLLPLLQRLKHNRLQMCQDWCPIPSELIDWI